MSHHPSEHLLTEFASGTLETGAALCVRTHLEQCHDCNRVAEDLNVLGAVMMRGSDEAACSDDLFDRVLGQLNSQPAPEPVVSDTQDRSALSSLIPGGIKSVPWKKIASGISSYELPVNDGEYNVKLLRVEKGRSVFQHTHSDTELTVLLQGGYSDELGSYTAGDFVECDGSHVHKPVAHRDQDCILLTAVSGKLRFTGAIGRLLNPIVKF
ncbi:MAG: ChrR family anti-sigma-E factor [Pseudomonadales bacterium]